MAFDWKMPPFLLFQNKTLGVSEERIQTPFRGLLRVGVLFCRFEGSRGASGHRNCRPGVLNRDGSLEGEGLAGQVLEEAQGRVRFRCMALGASEPGRAVQT